MIRPAVVPGDLPALLLLELVLFPGNAFGERLLEHELTTGRGWVVGSPAYGYALTRDDGIIDVTRLGVLPDWQGKGVGSALLDHVIGLGKETMLTVEKANVRALRLYLRRGFEISGDLRKTGAWVMRRPAQSARALYSAPQAQR
jgi:[ribosomal protein S18]-alanine N-acetyltransferase